MKADDIAPSEVRRLFNYDPDTGVMTKNNKSGCTGVFFDERRQSYRAEIGRKGKSISLGLYDNLFDAVAARRSAERRYGYHSNHGREK